MFWNNDSDITLSNTRGISEKNDIDYIEALYYFFYISTQGLHFDLKYLLNYFNYITEKEWTVSQRV